VRAAIPGFTARENQIKELIDTDRSWNARAQVAAATGSGEAIADVLTQAHNSLARSEQTRAMKREAQGLHGAGGRPAPEDPATEAWERIKFAGAQTYGELRHGQ
jgi:hypothetical protein